jgi:hypothetical protein
MPALKLNGVVRDNDDQRGLILLFNRKPTDDEFRTLHDFWRDWMPPEIEKRAKQ